MFTTTPICCRSSTFSLPPPPPPPPPPPSPPGRNGCWLLCLSAASLMSVADGFIWAQRAMVLLALVAHRTCAFAALLPVIDSCSRGGPRPQAAAPRAGLAAAPSSIRVIKGQLRPESGATAPNPWYPKEQTTLYDAGRVGKSAVSLKEGPLSPLRPLR